jgi:hypothetical protein
MSRPSGIALTVLPVRGAVKTGFDESENAISSVPAEPDLKVSSFAPAAGVVNLRLYDELSIPREFTDITTKL